MVGDVEGGLREREVVKDNVSSNFDNASIVIRMEDPDKVALCIFCITEKDAGFTARLEFGGVIDDNMCNAFNAKGAEVGKVQSMAKPQREGSDTGRER